MFFNPVFHDPIGGVLVFEGLSVLFGPVPVCSVCFSYILSESPLDLALLANNAVSNIHLLTCSWPGCSGGTVLVPTV